MKKIFALMLCLAFALSLIGCGKETVQEDIADTAYNLTAVISEINGATIIVDSDKGRLEVPMENIPSSPEPQVGDTIEVVYYGAILETNPGRFEHIISVEVVLPIDFSFSIVWNTYGISSYDSQTGELVKTNDATDVSKYTDYVKMSENELKQIYEYLCVDIKLSDYPTIYDPFNAQIESDPNQTIIISVTANGETHTVTCKDIAFGALSDCYCDEAKAFMTAQNNIVTLITSLPQWQAFPEYEKFYE